MIRLFTGITLPSDVAAELQMLRASIDGAHWVVPTNYHLTLSFIGDVDEATAEDIHDILTKIHTPPMTLTLKGTGCFADAGSRKGHLWMGVAENDILTRLQHKIDHALAAHQIPVEKRKYTPHVTLARVPRTNDPAVVDFMRTHNLYQSRPFPVHEYLLYESLRGKEEAYYRAVASYPLY